MKKISLLTLGAALIAVPVLAAPGGAKADADGNGVLTRAEVQTNATAMFAKMDANGDGKLDRADRAAKRTEMQAEAFERFDANKDDQVTADERQAQRAAMKEKRAEWRAKRAAPAATPAN